MNMDFGANKTHVEVISFNGKWYRKSWKEFDELKNIDQTFYCSNYCDVIVNKYCLMWNIIKIFKK